MKRLSLFLLLLLFAIPSFSQSNSNKEIKRQKTIFGSNFYLNGEKLTFKRLESVVSDIPQSYKYIHQAKTLNTFSFIFSFAGGFLIGWPLGDALAGGDPDWNLALAGAGCLVVGIPLSVISAKKVQKGVDFYNQSCKTVHKEQKYELNLAVNTNGLGLVINF